MISVSFYRTRLPIDIYRYRRLVESGATVTQAFHWRRNYNENRTESVQKGFHAQEEYRLTVIG